MVTIDLVVATQGSEINQNQWNNYLNKKKYLKVYLMILSDKNLLLRSEFLKIQK